MSFTNSVNMWYIRSLLVLNTTRYTEELCLVYNTFFFSIYISLNIFRSNKFVVSFARVDIDKSAKASLNVQVKVLLLLSEVTYWRQRDDWVLDNSNDIML
jgi:hypothetical protein